MSDYEAVGDEGGLQDIYVWSAKCVGRQSGGPGLWQEVDDMAQGQGQGPKSVQNTWIHGIVPCTLPSAPQIGKDAMGWTGNRCAAARKAQCHPNLRKVRREGTHDLGVLDPARQGLALFAKWRRLWGASPGRRIWDRTEHCGRY